jgi:hypothetical protein
VEIQLALSQPRQTLELEGADLEAEDADPMVSRPHVFDVSMVTSWEHAAEHTLNIILLSTAWASRHSIGIPVTSGSRASYKPQGLAPGENWGEGRASSLSPWWRPRTLRRV